MYKLLTFSMAVLFSTLLTGQQAPTGMCGTSAEDQLQIRDRMFKNREELGHIVQTRTGAIRYIPVNYHLVAKADRTGRLRIGNVFTNLCAINKIYEDQEIQFYIRNINFVNNDFLYDNPSSDLGRGWATSLANNNRNAVNIICASKANAAEPGVLAFYNPGGDYIVSGNAQVNGNGTTLAHEIGHFFSLAHTFFGWEATTYTCNTPTPTTVNLGGQVVNVEYADRNKRINGQLSCKISSDGFCDTPADYNLGFGWVGGNCAYVGCAKDPDNLPLDPEEKNIMSYFLNCLQFFSAEQKAAILRDYSSTARSYLRTVTYTPQADVNQAVKIIAPTDGDLTEGFNIVKLEWEAVPNATHYMVEMGEGSLTIKNTGFITRRTDTTLTNLVSNKRYVWRVFAYNANSFCHTQPNPVTFTTGRFPVSSDNPGADVARVNWYQAGNGQVVMEVNSPIESESHFEFFNLEGKSCSKFSRRLQVGSNAVEVDLGAAGTYVYRVTHSTGSITGKVFIQ